MADAGELKARATLENAQFLGALQEMVRKAGESSEGISKHLEGIGSAFSKITSALGGLAELGGMAKFADSVLEAARDTAKLEAAFNALNGPSEETKKVFEEIKGLELHSLFDFEKTLGPAAKSMMVLGVSAEQASKTMKAVVDQAAGLKMGPEWIEAVTGAIGRMQSHMVATVRDMKALQVEGVNAYGALAKAIGTSIPEAIEKVKKGMIDSQTVTDAVTKYMEDRWGGAADKSVNSWKGAMHLFDEATKAAREEIGKALIGVLNDLAPIIKGVAETVGDLAKKWGELSPPVKDAVIVFTTALGLITSITAIMPALQIAIKALGTEMTLSTAGISLAAGALALLGKWAYDNWPAVKVVLTEAGSYLGKVFEPSVKVLKWVYDQFVFWTKAMWTSLTWLGDKMLGWVQSVTGWFSKASAAAGQGAGGIGDELKKLGKLWDDAQAQMKAAAQAADAKKKAADEEATAEAKRLKLEQERERQAIARANAEKERAAEAKKRAAAEKAAEEAEERWIAEYNKSVHDLDKSVWDLSNTFAKAHEAMAAATKKTIEITVKFRDQLPEAFRAAYDAAVKLNQAFAVLGMTPRGTLDADMSKLARAVLEVEAAEERHLATETDVINAQGKLVDETQKYVNVLTGQLKRALEDGEITQTQYYEKVMEEAARYYEELIDTGDQSEEMSRRISAALEVVEKANKKAGDSVKKDLADAYHSVGMKTDEELQAAVTTTEQMWQRVIDAGKKGTDAELRLHIAYLKAVQEQYRSRGDDLPKEQQKQLQRMEEQVKRHTKKHLDIWYDFFKSLESRFKQFGHDVMDTLWDRLFGKDPNADLKRQEEDLKRSLEERSKAFDKFVADNAKKLADATKNYHDAMAQEEKDTREALAKAAKDHDDYTREVQRNIEKIREKWADQLEQETQQLRDELRQRQQDYEDFVEDTNKKLSRIGQDTATSIQDETQDTQHNIAERQKDYDREVEDTNKKIAKLREANGGANSEEEDELRLSLKRKQEDLQDYINEQNTRLDRFVRDAKLRQQRETEDAKEELGKRKQDLDEYTKENEHQQSEAYANYKKGLDEEVGAQLESLKQKDADYEAAKTEILKKSEDQKAQITKDYQDTTTALHDELESQKAEYDAFVLDITGPNGKLAQLYAQHVTVWGQIGSLVKGVLSDIGKAMLHLISDEILGAVMKKLLGKDGFGGLGEILGDVIHKITGIGTAIGDLDKAIATSAANAASNAATTATTTAADTAEAGVNEGMSVPAMGEKSGTAAAGGASSTGGGLMSVLNPVSAIANIVTAVSSVIGIFQNMHQETSLNAIEHNTRYSMMYLGERADGGILGVLFKIDEHLQAGVMCKAVEAIKNHGFWTYADRIVPTMEQIRNNIWDYLVPFARDNMHLATDLKGGFNVNEGGVVIYVTGNNILNNQMVDNLTTRIADTMKSRGGRYA